MTLSLTGQQETSVFAEAFIKWNGFTDWPYLRIFWCRWGYRRIWGRNWGLRLSQNNIRVFTVGHKEGFFAPDGAIDGYGSAVGDYLGGRRTLVGYTADFSKEISASVSIEDHDALDGDDGSLDKGGGKGIVSDVPYANDSTYLPELVGNVVGKFDWGLIFGSGAVGQYREITTGGMGSAVVGAKDDYIGYAFGLGGNVNLDGLSKGDAIQAKFGYSDGSGELEQTRGVWNNSVVGFYNLNTAQAWTAQGSFKHNWNPTWSSTAYGGYVNVSRETDGSAAMLAKDAGEVNNGWNIAANLQWSPVEKFLVGGEVFYANVNKANSVGGENNYDAVGSVFRVQRSF